MSSLQLILREIAYRKFNFALGVVGIVAAVTLFVFFFTASQASRAETSRITRDIGLNLRILPAATDMDRFYTTGYANAEMPEDYVDKLASHSGLRYRHMLARLQRKIEWNGMEVLLAGCLPEKDPPHIQQGDMQKVPPPGHVFLGYQLATTLGIKPGETIDVRGKTFTVDECQPEMGTDEDARLTMHLHDAQVLLDAPGKINEIMALDCTCFDKNDNALAVLREQLAGVLPEAKVIQMRQMAEARLKQRKMVENYVAFILPFVLGVAAAWIGLLAMLNVRERTQEIGTLRAVGYGSGKIAALFLGKATLVGLFGGLIGFALGTEAALIWGPNIFEVTGAKIAPIYGLLVGGTIAAIVFAALSSLVPTMMAVTQDPAATLRDQ